jgi:thiamine-phosphate pyrophosphorylase
MISLVDEFQADGAHIGQSDDDVVSVRKILPNSKIIGLSLESMEDFKNYLNLENLHLSKKDEFLSQTESTNRDELQTKNLVDYFGVSPIFPTATKTDTKVPWGLEGLRKLRDSTEIPLVAIGGINMENAKSIMKAGADSLAVVSAICSAKDPKKAAKILKELVLEF